MKKTSKPQMLRDEYFRITGQHALVSSNFGRYIILSTNLKFKNINYNAFIDVYFEDVYEKMKDMSTMTEFDFFTKMLPKGL